MKNRLVTLDGTRVLTVEEYDRFLCNIPKSMKSIFVIAMITGLRYAEIQKLYDNPQWYHKYDGQWDHRTPFTLVPSKLDKEALKNNYGYPQSYSRLFVRDKIILPKETHKKEKPPRTVNQLPYNFFNIFSDFINNKKPPDRSSWNKDLARWSEKAEISPKVGLKTPRKTMVSWMLKSGFSDLEIYSILECDPIAYLKNCQRIFYTEDELEEIKDRLVEWNFLKFGYHWYKEGNHWYYGLYPGL